MLHAASDRSVSKGQTSCWLGHNPLCPLVHQSDKDSFMSRCPLSSKHLSTLARTSGRELTTREADLLAAYLQLLDKWNNKMNLVGPKDWETILTTLIIDSWHLADFLHTLSWHEDVHTLDLGAGAGLPGIPLRVFWDKGEYVLVEPRQKRAVFMQTAIRTMQLERTRVAACRVEQLEADNLPATLVLSRALCPWREFLPMAGPLLQDDGLCLVMSHRPEPSHIPSGWQVKDTYTYAVGRDQRSFWLFGR